MNGARPNGHARADDTAADWQILWAALPEATRKLILSPPMPGEDRSKTAASVILSLIARGWSDDKIAAVITAHPQGIGARYAEGNDLVADIRRLREKSEAKPSNATSDDFSADPVQIFDPWEQYVVPPFPSDVLPDDARRFVEAQSKVIGCDPSAMAMATLASLSAAIDHRSALKMLRNGDWYAHSRLWVLLVGDPSRKKTPAIRAATKCLEDHEQALWDKWNRERDALKAEDPEAEDPPKPLRFVVGDTTIEALAEILTRGDRGLLVRRDEIAGWIGGMERYGSGNRGASADRAFWLQAYDGGPFTVDRIKRGEQRIKNLSVSLLGGIQPERLQELRGLTSDGCLQRFLPVVMRAAVFPVDVPTHPASDAYRKLTLSLVNARYATVIMTDEALAAMTDARRRLHDLEQVCGGVAQGFQAFVGKLHGILGTMALILHMIHDPLDGNTSKVEATTVMNAAKLVDQFILPHAFEFYRTAENATEGDRLQKVASYILTSGKDRIVASDLTANVALCRRLTLWDLNQRVSPLIAGGWLTPEERGPVSRAWTVNPAVLEQLREQAEIEERRKSELAALMASPRKRAT